MRSEIAAQCGGDTRGVMAVRPPTGRLRKKRLAALVCGLVLAAGLGLASAPAALAVNPEPVQYYYVPFTETQLLSAFSAINADAITPITSYIGITAIASGTLIYYDQWENGYDIDIANPADLYSGSNPDGIQIWGDGITANGTCPRARGPGCAHRRAEPAQSDPLEVSLGGL